MEPTEGNTPEMSGPPSAGHPDHGTAADPETSPGTEGHEERGNAPILGKYRNIEDLIKAHRHLESKLGELGPKASLLEKAAARWTDDRGKPLSTEEFIRRSEEALHQGVDKDHRVMPRDPMLNEVEQRLSEYDAILGQLYLERERTTLREKFPEYDDDLLDFCLSHALPEESPEELARFIARQRQAGADQWARGKLNARGLATEREGGASPPTMPARLSFRPGGQAVTPLQAWMAEPET
ncbi:MAG: hypothetical protein JRG73_11225 [Deltaproteobacteria bacterium]|nr:hypothetical protein [Deltaproteobacteria bacterium]